MTEMETKIGAWNSQKRAWNIIRVVALGASEIAKCIKFVDRIVVSKSVQISTPQLLEHDTLNPNPPEPREIISKWVSIWPPPVLGL